MIIGRYKVFNNCKTISYKVIIPDVDFQVQSLIISLFQGLGSFAEEIKISLVPNIKEYIIHVNEKYPYGPTDLIDGPGLSVLIEGISEEYGVLRTFADVELLAG